jgi:signal transduction histidine kinase
MESSEQLIREISHSLNTPLGQIELTIARFMEGGGNSHLSAQLMDAALKARQNITVCRAVLAAYRELTSIALEAPRWDVDDLPQALDAAVRAFPSHTDTYSADGVLIDVRLPRAIRGYSNYLMLTLLLPLLHNAIEAAPSYTDISCWLIPEDKLYKLFVRNTARPMPDIDKLGTVGYTTKGVDHGYGISSVRTLISRQAHLGANLTFSAAGEWLIAALSLPLLRGISND